MGNPRHATPRKATTRDSAAFGAALPKYVPHLKKSTLRLLGKLTRIHLVVLSLAMCSIVLAVTVPFGEARKSDRVVIDLTLNSDGFDTQDAQNPNAQDMPSALQQLEQITAAKIEAPKTEVREVKRGDTLSGIFASAGLGANSVHAVMRAGPEGKALATLMPGESINFEFDHLGDLARVSRVKSPLETTHFLPDAGEFQIESVVREPEIKRIHRSGIVDSSLSLAAEKAGLSASTTMNMANIFGGVMDFALDVRGGDRFTIIYEEHYIDGKKLKDGAIVAAQYVNAGTEFNAFRYVHNNGEVGYYNEEGVSMRKVFLRAPLDFTRVSSSFNLRRLHPITKKVRPHRGIDYAARTGTAVFSVGDGRVVTSGYSKSNGKYVIIRHGDAYTTKYLHLHKRNVKRGQRVKQGQIIGQVGCTGLCTGPHLHYEFLVNGVHRNPRTIIKKLPKAKKLAKAKLPAFNTAIDSRREILQHFSQQFELAALQQAE
ncbi:MAG: peptidoglycan DD-metalloendopeptidase family protein [Gammaproteobacteria bacterium]|nr:peptidoglycan DD-metalloendopeptidase family protein [Gammaproteobacteria bacterium]NND38057.1 peptidoglycan DD-metalloendopeptidase family protein [Pseudomonadales bacterium]NNL11259.1 peptidoglycan DD-metalloendopeptidase family protein [Pseudomonadales bacterium]NNM12642.1 peptidoglycan DD-metalloendopeptidase family protein [Pseudomonadales bacterium]